MFSAGPGGGVPAVSTDAASPRDVSAGTIPPAKEIVTKPITPVNGHDHAPTVSRRCAPARINITLIG
jgi:hypothetical protein